MYGVARSVPWIDECEFEQVYQWLFAETTTLSENVELGIERVRAWAIRGNVPLAVEMTALLVQLQLRDHYGLGGEWLSQHELRTMYSMAIIRFVNGIVDTAQTGLFAMSIGAIAERLGLPLWFVELRHAGTHEHLPGLAALRDACSQALNWIRECYWKVVLAPENPIELDENAMNHVKTLLNTYKEARKTLIKESKAMGSSNKLPTENALNKLLKHLTPDMVSVGVVNLLVSVGGMVPVGKKKRASVENMSLSDALIDLWKPLIQTLNEKFPGFSNELVTEMLKILNMKEEFVLDESLIYHSYTPTKPTSEAKEEAQKAPSYLLTLTCWLRYFVEDSASPSNAIIESDLVEDILESCLRNPNYYTRCVLQAIAELKKSNAIELKPFIEYIDLMLIRNNRKQIREEVHKLKSMNENSMHDELTALSEQLVLLSRKSKSAVFYSQPIVVDSDSAWAMYDAASWKSCPIGCLPNGDVPDFDVFPVEPQSIAMEQD
ncbi:Las1-like-domain-containing protein [Spinellus fusiger]|nr:Las1-like-domain-containing protein [Spinellus fusiger]